MRTSLALLFYLFSLSFLFSNKDSLQHCITAAPNDSVRLVAYVNYANFFRAEPPKVLEAVEEMFRYSEKIRDKRMQATWLKRIGGLYHKQSLYDKAIEFAIRSASLYQETGDKIGMANSYNNMGNSYTAKGVLTGDTALFNKSVDCYLKSIDYRREAGDLGWLKNSYNNIATTYMAKKQFAGALDYFYMAYKEYAKPPRDNAGLRLVTLNIGDAYVEMGKMNKSTDELRKALTYYQNAIAGMDKEDVRYAGTLNRIGLVYMHLGDFKKAYPYLKEGMFQSQQDNDPEEIMGCAEALSHTSEKLGNLPDGLKYLKMFIRIKDSLQMRTTHSNIEQMQAQFDYGMKEAQLKTEQAKKDAIAEEEKKEQKIVRNSFLGAFVLTFLIAILVFRSYRTKKRDNAIISDQKKKVEEAMKIIERQKAEVEEKQKEIIDSIKYAQRIQKALIASESYIGKSLERLNKDVAGK